MGHSNPDPAMAAFIAQVQDRYALAPDSARCVRGKEGACYVRIHTASAEILANPVNNQDIALRHL